MEYTLYVDDNFHHMDEQERYLAGRYDTAPAAVEAAKQVLDEYLRGEYRPGSQASALYQLWLTFGPDPFIVPAVPAFNSREFAKQRCTDICGQDSTEP